MIAVTFALPNESKDFRAQFRHASSNGAKGISIGNIGRAEVILTHTGVGQASATSRVRQLLEFHRPEWLVCAGYAGALDRRLGIGDLVIGTNVSSPELVARCNGWCSTEGPTEKPNHLGKLRCFLGPIATEALPIESVAAKNRLAIRTGALAGDMETSAVAAECTKAGVPMLAIRAISDTAAEGLPVPLDHWFDMERQQPRPVALFKYLVRNPGRVFPFATFVANLPIARARMTEALVAAIGS